MNLLELFYSYTRYINRNHIPGILIATRFRFFDIKNSIDWGPLGTSLKNKGEELQFRVYYASKFRDLT